MDKKNKQKIIKILLIITILWALGLQYIFWPEDMGHESFPKKIISIFTK